MARRDLVPITYDGVGLTTIGRRAFFDYDEGAFDTPRHDPVALERIGRFPSHTRMQPQGKTFPLKVVFKTCDTESQFRAVSRLFNPSKGLKYLVVEDLDRLRKRLHCVAQQIVLEEAKEHPMVIPLWAPTPILEDNTPTTASGEINGVSNPITFSLRNIGTYDALPIFTAT